MFIRDRSASQDWAKTSKELRDLMADWKAAPRASRAEEDKLWKRFKAAQDAFYAARTASEAVSYTHLRAHETVLDLVCRLLLEKKTTLHTTTNKRGHKIHIREST